MIELPSCFLGEKIQVQRDNNLRLTCVDSSELIVSVQQDADANIGPNHPDQKGGTSYPLAANKLSIQHGTIRIRGNQLTRSHVLSLI
jgi:hypothetical protein